MQTWLDQEVQSVDLLQCLFHQRCLAVLECDQKRQMRFWVAGFLEHRVYIDFVRGENCGESCDDAGTVLYQKSQVVLGGEVGADGWRLLDRLSGVVHPILFRVSDG